MPCKIFPKLNEKLLETLPSKAEAKFYRACVKHLPSSFLVLHSVSLIFDGKMGKHHIGECDFVIFDPDGGLFVVEVKGGGIIHDPEFGPAWYSEDRYGKKYEIKDPFKQSEHYRFKVLEVIKRLVRGLKQKNFPVGHSVAFPDISVDKLGKIISLSRPREIIACAEDLDDLGTWYAKSSSFWSGKKSLDPIGKQLIREVEKVFLKPIYAKTSLSVKLKDEESERIKLTDDQARLLLSLEGHDRVNITGGAGTGKTVLAKKLAEQFSDQGLKVAFICFNKALGDIIRLYFSNNSLVDANTYFGLFESIIGNRIDEFMQEAHNAYPNADLWRVIKPFAFALALEDIEDTPYDAIIVDEGQDLGAEMWMPIEMLVEDMKSKFYIFSDTNQSLYSNVDSIPKLSPSFLLHSNCRNTQEIHEEAYKDYSGPVISPPPIKGLPVNRLNLSLISEQRELIIETLDQFTKLQDLDLTDLVILVAKSENFRGNLDLLLSLKTKYKFIEDETVKHECVRVSTIKRFKGLEALAVIIWGLNELSTKEQSELSYVGVSRAKSICYLIN